MKPEVQKHIEYASGFLDLGMFDDAGTEADLALLREMASGSSDRSTGVEGLLAKLGVATENEAIQYAIKAGVTWQ